jgi:Na+/melibiose symporter-like transporter
MGVSLTLGNGLGILAGLGVSHLLANPRIPYPANYAAVLLLGTLLLTISFLSYQLNREPVGVRRHAEEGWRTYLHGLVSILRTDASFRWFIVYQSLSLSALMGLGLFMVYGIRAFDLAESRTGEFVAVSTVAAMVASPLLGTLGDRHGHRLVLAVSTAAYVFAAGLAIVAHHGFMMYPIFALAAVHVGAQMIAFRNVVYELAPVDRRPSYVALASLAPAPAALAFPVLGGWLAQRASWGYAAAFGLSAALCAAAWLVLMTRVHMRAGPALVAPEAE